MSQNEVSRTKKQHESSSHENGEVTSLDSDVEPYTSVDRIEKLAMPGDIIEFHRGNFADYALYLGNGKVMRFGMKENTTSEGTFQEGGLTELSDTCKARVRNHEHVAQSVFNLKSKKQDAIVGKARTFLNVTVPYEVDFRNSEYYCTLWRYGLGFSTEAARQAWRPTETDRHGKCTDKKERTHKFGADTYAKYKQMSKLERNECADDLC